MIARFRRHGRRLLWPAIVLIAAAGTTGYVSGNLPSPWEDWMLWAAAGLVVLLFAAAILLRSSWMTGVAAVGVVVNVPAAVSRWFPGSVTVALVLLAAGCLVVVIAVTTARRGRGRRTLQAPEPGSRTLALATASAVVAGAAAVVAAIARG